MDEKVALLNIQRCNSHGAVLLAYALEQVLADNGYTAENLDYKYAGRITEKSFFKKAFKVFKIKAKKHLHLSYAGKKFLDVSLKKEYDLQSENFGLFRNNYLHLTREITDVNDSILKDYDRFVVGSDVVWKPQIAACEDREIYFLKSVPENALRIAYAASVGTNDEQELTEHDEYYQGAFDSLDRISIREQSMIPFVQKYTDKDVVSVIDPIFLLTPERYREIELNSQKKVLGKPYTYLYILSGNKEAVKFAEYVANKYNYSILADMNDDFDNSKIITVNSESAISCGPREFIYNIRNAKMVITDSFHATAFSILFNIDFYVFNRGNISVRMRDLADRFNLSDRMCNGKLSDKSIDWDSVNSMISKERESGLNYLLGALKGKNNNEE